MVLQTKFKLVVKLCIVTLHMEMCWLLTDSPLFTNLLWWLILQESCQKSRL